jgi:HlyD family secretion protein
MHPSPKRIIPVVVLLALAGLGYWFYTGNRAAAQSGGLTATGTIEATNITISPELAGRVAEVKVVEGQHVAAGETLVTLDGALLQAQRAQAAAALAAAQVNYDLVSAGAGAQQLSANVSRAQAELVLAQNTLQDLQDNAALATAQAKSDLANARKALDTARKNLSYIVTPDMTWYQNRVQDAQNALTNAQQGTTQIDIGAYFAQLKAAQDLVDKLNERLGKIKAAIEGCQTCDPLRYVTVDRFPQTLAQAQDDYNGAVNHLHDLQLQKDQSERANATAIRDAQKHLDDVRQNLADAEKAAQGSPNAYDLGVAQGRVTVAEAAVARAEDRYNKIKGGPDPELLAAAQARLAAAKDALSAAQAAAAPDRMKAAQAQLQVAQSALDLLDVQISKLTLKTATGGTVLSRAVEPGEAILPGAAALVLADLSHLQITVYVPEDQLGAVTLGQTASVKVDSFANTTFSGAIIHISDQAEFTPRNVQTVEGRKTTVFAVKLSIDNPDGKLKAGMPADVTFGK